jgi:hypothetical protein
LIWDEAEVTSGERAQTSPWVYPQSSSSSDDHNKALAGTVNQGFAPRRRRVLLRILEKNYQTEHPAMLGMFYSLHCSS